MGTVIRAVKPLSTHSGISCWGTGFVAMDVVDVDGDTFAAVGGSCGNVMAILAWLGWTTRPIARLGDDATGGFIREELLRLGVDLRCVTAEKEMRSPIVLQRFVLAPDGTRTHRFSLTCPGCGRWLPRHRPVTLAQWKSLASEDESPEVFYFDRVSPASLRIAQDARDGGALVVFEPSSVEEESKFQRAVDTCHVLKYSHERLGHVPDLPFATSPALIVETRGASGLRYRWSGEWSQLDAFRVEDVVDAAGCGDWCSAMFIHSLGRGGARNFLGLAGETVERVLRECQAAAAINCGFRGARGAMQVLGIDELNEKLQALVLGTTSRRIDAKEAPKVVGPSLHYCEQCDVEVSGLGWAAQNVG